MDSILIEDFLEDHFECGVYRIIRDALLSSGPSLGDGDIGSVPIGALVEVLEVVYLQEDQRVRARIRFGGADAGWISLKSTDGQKVWAEKVAEELWVTDNSMLNADSPGIGYRHSQSIDDRVEDQLVCWGQAVRGCVTPNGDWLEVGGLFLPMKLDGVVVLRRQDASSSAPRIEIKRKASTTTSSTLGLLNPFATVAEELGRWGTEATSQARAATGSPRAHLSPRAHPSHLSRRLDRQRQRQGGRVSGASCLTAATSRAHSHDGEGDTASVISAELTSPRPGHSPQLLQRMERRRRRRLSGASLATSSSATSAVPSSASALAAAASEELWVADNSRLCADSPGIGYRRTQNASDMLDDEHLPWGEAVRGRPTGRGGAWLQVGDRFLPMELDGVPVLQRQAAYTSHSEHAYWVLARRQRRRQCQPESHDSPATELTKQVGQAFGDLLSAVRGAPEEQGSASEAAADSAWSTFRAGSLVSSLSKMAPFSTSDLPAMSDLPGIGLFAVGDDLPSDAESEEHLVFGEDDTEEAVLSRLEECPATRRARLPTAKARKANRKPKKAQAASADCGADADAPASGAGGAAAPPGGAAPGGGGPVPAAPEAAVKAQVADPPSRRSSSSSGGDAAADGPGDLVSALRKGASLLGPVLGIQQEPEEEYDEHNIWGRHDTEEALRERWRAFKQVQEAGLLGPAVRLRKESPRPPPRPAGGSARAGEAAPGAGAPRHGRLSALASSGDEGTPGEQDPAQVDDKTARSTAPPSSTRPSTSSRNSSRPDQRRLVLPSRPSAASERATARAAAKAGRLGALAAPRDAARPAA